MGEFVVSCSITLLRKSQNECCSFALQDPLVLLVMLPTAFAAELLCRPSSLKGGNENALPVRSRIIHHY